MNDDPLRDSIPYSLLARILRKAQGVRDAETFALLDVGEEVMRLRDAFTSLRTENARLCEQIADAQEIIGKLLFAAPDDADLAWARRALAALAKEEKP